ncbi:MAG: hypothetical protein ABIT47_00660 [Candidatus Paceibacterota bacterium]
MDNPSQPSTKATHLTLGKIIIWLLSVGLLVSGIISLFTNFGMGLTIILASLVILPPLTKYLKEKHNFSISGPLKIVLLFGIIMIGGFIISQGKDTAPAATETRPSAAYDVPSLLGLSLKELEAKLGTSSYDTEPTAQQLAIGGIDTWEKSWNNGDYSLMATYDIKTKKVTDLFLSADTDAAFKKFEDTDNILTAGNLSKNDSHYSVEFVKAKNGPGYTGAIVRLK